MSTDTKTTETTKATPARPSVAASAAALAVAVALLGVGIGVGRATGATIAQPAPQPAQEAAPAPSAAPGAPSAVRPSPTPTPAVYGATGLAGQYARLLGHDSLSAACAAGIEWVCGVTTVEPSSEYGTNPKGRTVTTTVAPMDGDAAAAEWLAISPASVAGIEISYAGGFIAQTVGTAKRETTP